jgi:hypothetical protein
MSLTFIPTLQINTFHPIFHTTSTQPLIIRISTLTFLSLTSTTTMTKLCTLCSTPRDILIRCQTDESQKWHFVCPGSCWKSVSGGVEDARGFEGKFPYYKYGGMVSLAFWGGLRMRRRGLGMCANEWLYSGRIEVLMDLSVLRNRGRSRRDRRKR